MLELHWLIWEDLLDMKETSVIAVSGTPGTGKTRFARLLARKLGINYVSLTWFAMQHDLMKCYDHKRRTYVIDELGLTRELRRYLATLKGQVLVEGHYSGRLVPKRFTEIVFVLRCDPDILKTRLKRRGYSDEKVRENVEAEVLDICLSEAIATQGSEKVTEIDTSAKPVQNCVEEALQILGGKKLKQIGRYDWLTELERKGRLDKFLTEQTVAWRRRSS